MYVDTDISEKARAVLLVINIWGVNINGKLVFTSH